MNIMRRVIKNQQRLCKLFDGLLPEKCSIDGNRHFIDSFVPKYIKPNQKIYDIGAGKNPCIHKDIKEKLSLIIVAIDIDEKELLKAPEGSYYEIICADIMSYQGNGDADIVICQALLEHIQDTDKAIHAISSIIKMNGKILIFVPSKKAFYARLNLLIPQNVKKKLLHCIFPDSTLIKGFPSYYDRCSPKEMVNVANRHCLNVAEAEFYYISAYFTFCFPIYFLWRIWVLLFHALIGEQAAETFSMALRSRLVSPDDRKMET